MKTYWSGKHLPEELKKKISYSLSGEKNYWYGKHLSEEHRKKISDAKVGKPSGGILFKKGRIPWNKGKTGVYSKELLQKMSDNMKGKWVGKKNPMYGVHLKHTDETKRKLRESRLSYMASGKMKFKDTSIEIAIENELKKSGIYYEKQVLLCKVAVVDFYLPQWRIVIQCDGNYWHNKPGAKNKDMNQDFILNFHGFNVFRFSETEIKESPRDCLVKVFEVLNKSF